MQRSEFFPDFSRDLFFDELKNHNIDVRPFFYPLSSLPMFEVVNNKISYDIYLRAFNLPSFHDITIEEQEKVVDIFKNYLIT